MENLDPSSSSDDDHEGRSDSEPRYIDPTDDLIKVIRLLCDRRDALRLEIDPDLVLKDIQTEYSSALLRRGNALALKACRRLITGHLRRVAALNPSEDDGPQFVLPGLHRVPTHVMYPVTVLGRIKIVAKHTRDATLAQHEECLLLKQTNSQRCIAREAQQVRIIDLLKSSSCDSLREWEERFGERAA